MPTSVSMEHGIDHGGDGGAADDDGRLRPAICDTSCVCLFSLFFYERILQVRGDGKTDKAF